MNPTHSQIIALACLLLSMTASGQVNASKEAVYEHIALRLTGDLPPLSLDINTTSTEAFLDSLQRSEGFQRHFAAFWNQRLKIEGPVGVTTITRTSSEGTLTLHQYMQKGERFLDPQAFNNQATPCATGAAKGEKTFYRIINPAANRTNRTSLINCTCEQAKMLKPWFDPSRSIAYCPGIEAADLCGPGLTKCLPRNTTDYHHALESSFTNEAGVLLSKIVMDNRPWSDALTTKQGVANGPLLAFIKRFGADFNVFMPGSYPDQQTNPLFNRQYSNMNWEWVNRGQNHLGIQSTMAFTRSTNGTRAKANRLREAFLCRSYGTIPLDAGEMDSAAVPLVSRKPCATCHASLEPFAMGFRGWVPIDENNYLFLPQRAVNGNFGGKPFDHQRGLSELLVASNDYKKCAAKTSFEFVIGRPMSDVEEDQMLPELISVYEKSDGRLWPVIKHVAQTDLFLGRLKGGAE